MLIIIGRAGYRAGRSGQLGPERLVLLYGTSFKACRLPLAEASMLTRNAPLLGEYGMAILSSLLPLQNLEFGARIEPAPSVLRERRLSR